MTEFHTAVINKTWNCESLTPEYKKINCIIVLLLYFSNVEETLRLSVSSTLFSEWGKLAILGKEKYWPISMATEDITVFLSNIFSSTCTFKRSTGEHHLEIKLDFFFFFNNKTFVNITAAWNNQQHRQPKWSCKERKQEAYRLYGGTQRSKRVRGKQTNPKNRDKTRFTRHRRNTKHAYGKTQNVQNERGNHVTKSPTGTAQVFLMKFPLILSKLLTQTHTKSHS